ncbi:MAG: MFS transporter [Patescibacteria group bacterium]|nr:MFS transporter [Patescibacteria group bacterium]MDE2116565.1 MFS transporter [Patescibacteria group bacterium]
MKVHPDVVKLGFVSFLTDVSSEAIFSVFSVFFTTVLGASAAVLGAVEGFADFSASSLDYLSGWLSDRTGERKWLAVLGYGFSTLAKFFLIIADTVSSLALFRIVERLGKSFRGPPRDAWLADVAAEADRGYSFGVHKAMDKAGAVVGPLVAFFVLKQLGQGMPAFKMLFIGAAVAALLAVVVLAIIKGKPGQPHRRDDMFGSWRELAPGFKRFLVPAGIFSLAYFSFSFLLLKAYDVGFSIADVVLLYALFNAAFALVSAPIGALGDRIGRSRLIMIEYALYAAMSAGFIFAATKWQVVGLFIVFGVFYSIDEAQSKAFIADIERERRGSAIGLYNFVTGLIYLPASVIAGYLWTVDSSYAFGFALAISLVALVTFAVMKARKAFE